MKRLPLAPPAARRQDEPTVVMPVTEPGRSSVSRALPAASRVDEPTVIAPLSELRRQTARGIAPPPEPVQPFEDSDRPVSGSRLPRDSSRTTGRYHLRDPQHGATEITLPPPRSDAGRARASPSTPGLAEAPANGAAEEHFRLAEALLARGSIRAAVFEAQRGMKLGPARPKRLALYAWLLYQRSGAGVYVPAHVWDYIERALGDDPACALALYYKGVLLGRAGRLAEAVLHLERALALDPSDQRACTELSLLALRTIG